MLPRTTNPVRLLPSAHMHGISQHTIVQPRRAVQLASKPLIKKTPTHPLIGGPSGEVQGNGCRGSLLKNSLFLTPRLLPQPQPGRNPLRGRFLAKCLPLSTALTGRISGHQHSPKSNAAPEQNPLIVRRRGPYSHAPSWPGEGTPQSRCSVPEQAPLLGSTAHQ